jgi:hypothetical protein
LLTCRFSDARCFKSSQLPTGTDGFLRAHSQENRNQHQETIDQLTIPFPDEWESYVQWFKDLPLFLEIEGLRIVYASWNEAFIRLVRGRSFRDPDFLATAATKGTQPEYFAVETLLKGPEIQLPDGQTCNDKDGTRRSEMRVAWWQSPKRKERLSYADFAVPGAEGIPDVTMTLS